MKTWIKYVATFYLILSFQLHAVDPSLPEGYDCLLQIMALDKPLGELPAMTICKVELKADRRGGEYGDSFSVLVPGEDFSIGQFMACKNLVNANIIKLIKVFNSTINDNESQEPSEIRAERSRISNAIHEELEARKGFGTELACMEGSIFETIVVSEPDQAQHFGCPVQLVGRVILEAKKAIPPSANILYSYARMHPIYEGEFTVINN